MAKQIKKKKFSNNQVVVFRFGERNLVGKVCNIKPVGKKSFVYDVTGENGIVYEELTVDSVVNHTIDTRLTKMYYKVKGISEDIIPEVEQEGPEMDTESVISSKKDESEERESTKIQKDEETLFSEEDTDPNW
jgi:hypothetical protein